MSPASSRPGERSPSSCTAATSTRSTAPSSSATARWPWAWKRPCTSPSGASAAQEGRARQRAALQDAHAGPGQAGWCRARMKKANVRSAGAVSPRTSRTLGGKIFACDMTMDIMGIKAEQLAQDLIEEYCAVGTYIQRGARVHGDAVHLTTEVPDAAGCPPLMFGSRDHLPGQCRQPRGWTSACWRR